MKNKKSKWLRLIVISCCFIYLIGMKESYAVEDGKATVGFYEVKKKEQNQTSTFPKTGDDSHEPMLLISGISILLVITGMISYRILKNEERI